MFRFWTLASVAALAAGCASVGAVPRPFPGVPPAGPSRSVAGPDRPALDRYALIQTALSLRGVPYRSGGADPGGFDCSGLIQYLFANHGRGVPRTVAGLYSASAPVPDRDVTTGDLVFFRIDGRDVSHVGLLIGGDEFLHAPRADGEVRVERLRSAYWTSRFADVRRIE